MKFDLGALEALECVIDTGSVAAAAGRLNKAQSAISYQLRRLEERLGVPIIDRSGYRLTLTPEGTAILAEARTILSKARELEHFAAHYRDGWEPYVAIFFDGALPIAPILGALEDLDRSGAPTRIELRVGFLSGVQEQFVASGGDLMIACEVVSRHDFAMYPLPPVELVLCCASMHPLARLDLVTLADLQVQTELVIQRTDATISPVRPLFGSRRAFHLSDFGAKLEAIRRGLGFGWIPTHLARPHFDSGEIVEINLPNSARYRQSPSIVTRADRPPGKAIRQLLERLLASDWDM